MPGTVGLELVVATQTGSITWLTKFSRHVADGDFGASDFLAWRLFFNAQLHDLAVVVIRAASLHRVKQRLERVVDISATAIWWREPDVDDQFVVERLDAVAGHQGLHRAAILAAGAAD